LIELLTEAGDLGLDFGITAQRAEQPNRRPGLHPESPQQRCLSAGLTDQQFSTLMDAAEQLLPPRCAPGFATICRN
jgi:hypothetical protein